MPQSSNRSSHGIDSDGTAAPAVNDSRQALVDLALVSLGSLALPTVAFALGIHQAILAWSQEIGPDALASILSITAVVASGCIVYAWRRTIEVRHLARHRNASEGLVRHLTRHDALTGLANRQALSERLEWALARERCETGGLVSLIVIDLDRFARVNEAFGHRHGDDLVCQVAARLERVRAETDLLARLEGSAFALLSCDQPEPAEATALARRLIAELRPAYEIDGEPVVFGIRAGIAFADGAISNSDELLRAAALACDRAKADGDVCRFEPRLDAQIREHQALERDLRRAIGRNQLTLEFQPLIELTDCRVAGFEALARWRHPTRGAIPPSLFIAIAEEGPLIVELGEWVLAEACRQAATWPAPLRVAVNLAPAQVKEPGVVELVARTLTTTGLAADRLELEITERTLLDGSPATLATLRQLKNLGVRLAMDDFGTGYSSLGYLSCFPFDKIKIDRSFVKRVTIPGASDIAIVRAVVALGASLNMISTAEGVETPAQLAALRAEGCRQVQGFLTGRPMPGAAVAGFLHARTRLILPADITAPSAPPRRR